MRLAVRIVVAAVGLLVAVGSFAGDAPVFGVWELGLTLGGVGGKHPRPGESP